jgi:site-specific DNA-methyltransferase (adenine-specific)
VFLREIAKRLLKGLEKEIPNLHNRINHIFKNQLYGIAITELTAHLTRRSVCCSKHAAGNYSVCDVFDDDSGNILFERTEHNWKDGKCVFCGANQENYARGGELETHAYQFIHTKNAEEFFKMKFDVIVGNPPYQMSDGGGTGSSAMPLYHKFVQQAKKMNPRYLTMIIPSRWFTGGKGLDNFRNEMLKDARITTMVDYFDSNECLSGGVCYFLWERDRKNDCQVISCLNGKKSSMKRPLLESGEDTFVRLNEAVSIIRKIKNEAFKTFECIVSARKPFGFDSMVKLKHKEFANSVKIFSYPDNGFINREQITKNNEWVNKYKVLIAKAYGERGKFPYLVLAKPFTAGKNTCCSETYLVIGPFDSKIEAAKESSINNLTI